MAEGPITADMVRDAGIAASMAANPNALPEPSIWFQDFSFGQTMWDAAYGNVDGGNVSGVGEAVADVAINNVLEMEERKRKEDDPAKDAGMITELAERQRDEIIRIGRISATRAELIAFSDAMKTPEFQARFRQALRDQGVPDDQIDGRMDRATELADLAIKINDGTATAADQARFEELEADETVAADLDTALDLNSGSDLSVNLKTSLNSPENDQAPVPNGDDAEFLAMMEGDSPVIASPDRQGPVITASYNANANEQAVSTNATPVTTPASAPAFGLDA